MIIDILISGIPLFLDCKLLVVQCFPSLNPRLNGLEIDQLRKSGTTVGETPWYFVIVTPVGAFM